VTEVAAFRVRNTMNIALAPWRNDDVRDR